MFGWFQKKGDKKVEELERSIKNSFVNMRADMGHISQWISHFQTKHTDHAKKFDELEQRMGSLEQMLAIKQAVYPLKNKKVRVQGEDEESSSKEGLPEIEEQIGPLPEGQRRVCVALAAMQREEPDTWSNLPKLASEVYPARKYEDVRSAILQLVNVLEAEGYLAKKKVRKSVYVYLKKEKMEEFKGESRYIEFTEKKRKK